MRGQAAVFELFLWNDTRMRFISCAVPPCIIPWAGPSMTDTVVSIRNCNKCLQLKQAMLSSLLLLNEINILDVSLSRHSYTCRERRGGLTSGQWYGLISHFCTEANTVQTLVKMICEVWNETLSDHVFEVSETSISDWNILLWLKLTHDWSADLNSAWF